MNRRDAEPAARRPASGDREIPAKPGGRHASGHGLHGLGLLMIPAVGSVLRRYGPAQERPVRVSAELRPAGSRAGPVGPGRLQPVIRSGRAARAYAAAGNGSGCKGVGLEPNADLAPRVPHQLFMIFQMMVGGLARGLDLGSDRRADEVRLVRWFSPCSGRPSSTTRWRTGYGLPTGWIRQSRCTRFRRRPGDSPHVRAGGLVLCPGAGPAEGTRPRRPSPAQPHADRAGDGTALVWLARAQCRTGAWCQLPRPWRPSSRRSWPVARRSWAGALSSISRNAR